jgi:hypothetical protein
MRYTHTTTQLTELLLSETGEPGEKSQRREQQIRQTQLTYYIFIYKTWTLECGLESKAKVKRRTFHEPNALKTMNNKVVFIDVIRFGSCEIGRLYSA